MFKNLSQFSRVAVLAVAACSGIAHASPSSSAAPKKLEKSFFTLSQCKMTPASTEAAAPLELLGQALKGKSIDIGEGASMAAMEAMLIQYYGMPTSLRSAIKDERSFQAVSMIAVLSQNNYVVASQMALGAAIQSQAIESPSVHYIHRLISFATEPYHDNLELTKAKEAIESADVDLNQIAPKPRAYARWLVRAAVYQDEVAFDAALSGFCQSSPVSSDRAALIRALKPASAYHRMMFPHPSVASGAEKDINPIRKK